MVELDIKLVVLHCKTKLWQNATPKTQKKENIVWKTIQKSENVCILVGDEKWNKNRITDQGSGAA